jgi:hypothetical protein
MTMSDKIKCLCSKCPIERECVDHECEVHDKLNADLEVARAIAETRQIWIVSLRVDLETALMERDAARAERDKALGEIDDWRGTLIDCNNNLKSAQFERDALRARLASVVEAGSETKTRLEAILECCIDEKDASACDECDEYMTCKDAKAIAAWNAAVAAVKEDKA